MAIDRGLLRLLLVLLLAIVLAVLWLFGVIASLAIPGWVPPAGLLAVSLACLL